MVVWKQENNWNLRPFNEEGGIAYDVPNAALFAAELAPADSDKASSDESSAATSGYTRGRT